MAIIWCQSTGLEIWPSCQFKSSSDNQLERFQAPGGTAIYGPYRYVPP